MRGNRNQDCDGGGDKSCQKDDDLNPDRLPLELPQARHEIQNRNPKPVKGMPEETEEEENMPNPRYRVVINGGERVKWFRSDEDEIDVEDVECKEEENAQPRKAMQYP
jgi:hypothetical protein